MFSFDVAFLLASALNQAIEYLSDFISPDTSISTLADHL